MQTTYEATLQGNRVIWHDKQPALHDQAVVVHITILDSEDPSLPNRGQKMADALNRLAQKGGISHIPDPSIWQRDNRQDRHLFGRDE